MTRYEQGFLTKCAEYGVDEKAGLQLMHKVAALSPRNILKYLNVIYKTDPHTLGLNGVTNKVHRTLRELRKLNRLTPGTEANLKQMIGLGEASSALASSSGLGSYEKYPGFVLRDIMNKGELKGSTPIFSLARDQMKFKDPAAKHILDAVYGRS